VGVGHLYLKHMPYKMSAAIHAALVAGQHACSMPLILPKFSSWAPFTTSVIAYITCIHIHHFIHKVQVRLQQFDS